MAEADHSALVSSSSSSAIEFNPGFFKSLPGFLKLLQLIIGIVVVGILSYYPFSPATFEYHARLFYHLVAVTFFVGTFLLIVCCVISLATASVLPKTVFEYIYHGTAFLLYSLAALMFLISLVQHSGRSRLYDYDAKMAAAVLGFFNGGLYLFSAVKAFRIARFEGVDVQANP